MLSFDYVPVKGKNLRAHHEKIFEPDVVPETYYVQELKAAETRARDLECVQQELQLRPPVIESTGYLNALALTNEYRKILSLKRTITVEWLDRNRRSNQIFLGRYFRRHHHKQLLLLICWAWSTAASERRLALRRIHLGISRRVVTSHFKLWQRYVQTRLTTRRMSAVRHCFDELQARRYTSMLRCRSLEGLVLMKSVFSAWYQLYVERSILKFQYRLSDLETHMNRIKMQVATQKNRLCTFVAGDPRKSFHTRVIVAMWRAVATCTRMLRVQRWRGARIWKSYDLRCTKVLCLKTWRQVAHVDVLTRMHSRNIDYVTLKHDVQRALIASRVGKLVTKHHSSTCQKDIFYAWHDECVAETQKRAVWRARTDAVAAMCHTYNILLLVMVFYQWSRFSRERAGWEFERLQHKQLRLREATLATASARLVGKVDVQRVMTRVVSMWRMWAAGMRGCRETQAALLVKQTESQHTVTALVNATRTRESHISCATRLHVAFRAWCYAIEHSRTRQAYDTCALRSRVCAYEIAVRLLRDYHEQLLCTIFCAWLYIRKSAKGDAVAVHLCAEVERARCAEVESARCAEVERARCAEVERARCAEVERARCAEVERARERAGEERAVFRMQRLLCGTAFLAWRLQVERAQIKARFYQCIWGRVARDDAHALAETLHSIVRAWHGTIQIATKLHEQRMDKFIRLCKKQRRTVLVQLVFAQWHNQGVQQRAEKLHENVVVTHRQREAELLTVLQTRKVAQVVDRMENGIVRMSFYGWKSVMWQGHQTQAASLCHIMALKQAASLVAGASREILGTCLSEWRFVVMESKAELVIADAKNATHAKLHLEQAVEDLHLQGYAQFLKLLVWAWRTCAMEILRASDKARAHKALARRAALVGTVDAMLAASGDTTLLSASLREWELTAREHKAAKRTAAHGREVAWKIIEPCDRLLSACSVRLIVISWWYFVRYKRTANELSRYKLTTQHYRCRISWQVFSQWAVLVEDRRTRDAMEKWKCGWVRACDVRRDEALAAIAYAYFNAWARLAMENVALQRAKLIQTSDRDAIARILQRARSSPNENEAHTLAITWKLWFSVVIHERQERASHCYYEHLFHSFSVEESKAKTHVLFRVWVCVCIHSAIARKCETLATKNHFYAELICGVMVERLYRHVWTTWMNWSKQSRAQRQLKLAGYRQAVHGWSKHPDGWVSIVFMKWRIAAQGKPHPDGWVGIVFMKWRIAAQGKSYKVRATRICTLTRVFFAWSLLCTSIHSLVSRVVDRWNTTLGDFVVERSFRAWAAIHAATKREASFSRREQVFLIANTAMQRKTAQAFTDHRIPSIQILFALWRIVAQENKALENEALSARQLQRVRRRSADFFDQQLYSATLKSAFAGWKTRVACAKELRTVASQALRSDALLDKLSPFVATISVLREVFVRWLCVFRVERARDHKLRAFTTYFNTRRGRIQIPFGKWKRTVVLQRVWKASRRRAQRVHFSQKGMLAVAMQLWKNIVPVRLKPSLSAHHTCLSQCVRLWRLWCRSHRAERAEVRIRRTIADIRPKITAALEQKLRETVLSESLAGWRNIVQEQLADSVKSAQHDRMLRRNICIQKWLSNSFTLSALRCAYHAWRRISLHNREVRTFTDQLNTVRSRVCSRISSWLPSVFVAKYFRYWHLISIQAGNATNLYAASEGQLLARVLRLSGRILSFRRLRTIFVAWRKIRDATRSDLAIESPLVASSAGLLRSVVSHWRMQIMAKQRIHLMRANDVLTDNVRALQQALDLALSRAESSVSKRSHRSLHETHALLMEAQRSVNESEEMRVQEMLKDAG